MSWVTEKQDVPQTYSTGSFPEGKSSISPIFKKMKRICDKIPDLRETTWHSVQSWSPPALVKDM